MDKKTQRSLELTGANCVETADAMEGCACGLLDHNRKLKDECLLKAASHLKASAISLRRAAGFVGKALGV